MSDESSNVDVLKYLPHRYPFLLIDKVIEIIPGERVTAVKNVSYNEPWCQGHYPGNILMPGVLIIEAMAQSSVFLFGEEVQGTGKYGYLCSVERVKFIKPVVPGDVLMIHSSVKERLDSYIKISCKCFVQDNMVAIGEFSSLIK